MSRPEQLHRETLYPLADRYPRVRAIRAVWTGEVRRPRAGDWYLSGAIIAAYRAHSDLSTAYPIARLVEVRTFGIIEEPITPQ